MKEKKSGVKERAKSPQRDGERTGRGAEEREGLESGEERQTGFVQNRKSKTVLTRETGGVCVWVCV